MKWTYNVAQEDDRRIVKSFLLFPRFLQGQARWLETVEIIQEYTCHGGWENLKFKS